MAQASQILSNNARLLKSSASKHAIFGAVIALTAVAVATVGVGYLQFGNVSLEAIIGAQKSNVALWILDFMPFVFALWGQYVSSMMAYEAGAMVVDQTNELRAQTSVLQHQAMHGSTHDALTDLPNRVLLRDRLAQAVSVAGRDRNRLAILIMDLDHFKEINDTLGHYNGDRVLKKIATRLQGVIQDPNTVARMGGDEFAIMLPKINRTQDATDVVSKIQKALSAPLVLEELKLNIAASIGIAFFPEHGTDADTLLQRADVAMYVAKKNRSGFVAYSSKLDDHSPHRLTLMGELRQAIDQNELLLHYQPKVDIKSGELTGVEALVRWNHQKHGLMYPDSFIPLAERTGLIKPLTLWVLNKGLKQCSAWNQHALDLDISINLSAQGLLDTELPETVAGLLASHDLAPGKLALEITESTIMMDKERAMEILTRLSDMGVRLSIDDFGTGYSSLAYLSKMPVKEIKIDKSFVMDMQDNKSNAAIVHATIDLGHNLGLSVVGEGVETQEVLSRLESLGCDAAQGYHLARPLAVEDFTQWIAQLKGEGALRHDGRKLIVNRRP
jgi:diguanylate cyclase (GGDEF)-like protein